MVTGYNGGKKKNEREPKAFRIDGPFFSFMRVPPTLEMSTGTAPCCGLVCHWRHAQASSAGHGAPLRLADVVVN